MTVMLREREPPVPMTRECDTAPERSSALQLYNITPVRLESAPNDCGEVSLK